MAHISYRDLKRFGIGSQFYGSVCPEVSGRFLGRALLARCRLVAGKNDCSAWWAAAGAANSSAATGHGFKALVRTCFVGLKGLYEGLSRTEKRVWIDHYLHERFLKGPCCKNGE